MESFAGADLHKRVTQLAVLRDGQPPSQAIAHARLKSDKVDAVMLARLLKADFLPTVWIPGERAVCTGASGPSGKASKDSDGGDQ
jgi:hypothetical protein